MDLSQRPLAPHPYRDALPELPIFTLQSADFVDSERLDIDLTGEGQNRSPHLCWSDVPKGTESFVLSCFDPDAPTPSGYWHWTIVNLPATVRELPAGAGTDDTTLQAATNSQAFHIRNDSGNFGYDGPFPPAGDRPHRYVFAVHALAVAKLELKPESATNATAHFQSLFNGLGRAYLTGTYQR